MKDFLKKLAEAGWLPHKGQSEYLESLARFRVLACGRRWGKTDAAAADIAGRIATRQKSVQLAIAPTVTQARIVFERVMWMLTAAGIAFVPYTTPYPSLRIKDGEAKESPVLHVLDARSGHEARFLRGQGADHILIDEAAYVPDSLIADTAMPMLATTGGTMTMISTPNGRNHFYRYFLRGTTGEEGFWSRSSPSEENPAVDKNYLLMQQELMTEKSFATEYLAEFRDSSSTVFGYDFIQEALSAPPVPFGDVSVGVDWARRRDFTAVAAVRGTRMQAEVLDCVAWTGLAWSTLIDKALEFAQFYKASLVVGDRTGVGEAINSFMQVRASAFRIEDFVFSRQKKHGIVNLLALMLEKRRLRLPPNVELIQELEAYEQIDTEGSPKYNAGYGHDDRVTALALAVHGLPRAGGATMQGIERR